MTMLIAAAAAFVQGARADGQFERRRFDVLTGWLELIRSFGIPAGLASPPGISYPNRAS